MKTVLLVGAGSVKNGWEPIHTALTDFYPKDIKNDYRNEIANLVLAQRVYLARSIKNYKEGNVGTQKPAESFLNEFNNIKKKICEELHSAISQGILSVQPEFLQVAEIVCSNTDQLKVISTNWDRVFDDELIKYLNGKGIKVSNEDILHIHGDIDSSDTIYLPTETIREPYRKAIHEQDIGKRHSDFLQYLQQTDRLIIYGLSLSPLDAELIQMIAAGIYESNLKNIIIIDPNHTILVEKIKSLYRSGRGIKIEPIWHVQHDENICQL